MNLNGLIQQAMSNSNIMQNPIAKNAFSMLQKGDTQGLNELRDNLCRSKGISADDVRANISQRFHI